MAVYTELAIGEDLSCKEIRHAFLRSYYSALVEIPAFNFNWVTGLVMNPVRNVKSGRPLRERAVGRYAIIEMSKSFMQCVGAVDSAMGPRGWSFIHDINRKHRFVGDL